MESWTPRVVLLPDCFQAAGQGLPEPGLIGASVTRVESADEAATILAEDAADLAVVVRNLPVCDPAGYEPLTESAGEGQVVQYLGPWCEGEERTGRMVDGFRRVFWHAWPAWWRRWLDRYRGGPAIAESFEGTTITVVADADAGHAIGAFLAEAGACCLRVGGPPPAHGLFGDPAVVVWDGAQLDGLEAERLRLWCDFARERRVPLVALLDFPRPETVAAARAIGAAAVLGKPCDGDLLRATIRDAIVHRRERSKRGASRRSRPPAGETALTRAAA